MLTSTDYFKAGQIGIKPATLRARIRRGWDKETAMTELTGQKAIEINKWRQIATDNGISKSTFDSRVYMQGMHERLAATEPVSKYPGMIEKAGSNGIDKQVFYQRVHDGWSPERAATQTVRKQRKRRVEV